MELTESRDLISAVDKSMAELFQQRMEAVRAVAEYKRERGLPIEDKEQEAAKVASLSALIEDEALRPFYVRFLEDVMDVSKQWQHRLIEGLKVAYSGVEGAFAHIAARRIFPDAVQVACASFEDAYNAVVQGACDVAVLPFENSFAGEVGQVIDLMFSGSLYVNGVYDLPVTHSLLGIPGARMDQVKTVVSHPQALSQCQPYLSKCGFGMRAVQNTAMAAQEVAAQKDPSLAAIASSETAELYGLQVLDHDINESWSNTTRFAVFSRVENVRTTRRDGNAFLLLFTVKDEVGGLAKAINVISAYDFNMRVLRSRPLKDLPWHYYFYAEVEGDDASQNGRQMIGALQAVCPTVKIAGRYTTSEGALLGGADR